MIREEKFIISHRPYAIDLSTVTGEQHEQDGSHTFNGRCRAVWFRRQGLATRACTGTLSLWAHRLPGPVDTSSAQGILQADLDGRYGGDTEGRWDGIRYWGAQELETVEKHLAVLKPMLENFPAVPDGFDGWYTFGGAR